MPIRIVTIVSAFALSVCLLMTGCSAKSSASDTGASNSSQPAAQAQSSSQANAKYLVSIDDCLIVQDYQGQPAAVVTFTFTNNSNKATSFTVAVNSKAFQDGVELDTAFVMNLDSAASLNEIKPGATTTVQKAYALDSNSDITVECEELFNFSDKLLAEKTFTIA